MKIKLPKIFYMKNIYVLFFFLICGFANAQIVNIPDANFKNALINDPVVDIDGDDFGDIDADSNDDGEIQVSEAGAVIGLIINFKNISSLEGIQSFVNVESLSCSLNNLTSLDLSANTNLKKLICYNNQLTSLDFSENPNLNFLGCGDNLLTSLNISQNQALETLYCYSNHLASLDINNNLNLKSISCRFNELVTLDTSQNSNLEVLACDNNQLENIDTSQNSNLITFACYNNLLTILDLSQNPNLEILNCWNNQLASLDLSYNVNLTDIYCLDNQLVELNLKNGNNTALSLMWAYNNPSLACIQVDDVNYANSQICDTSNGIGWCIDATTSYSENCLINTEDFATTAFQLFPNPTGNFLNIQSKEKVESVKIYTTQGILIMEVSSKNVDVSQLTAGLYLIQITAHGKSLTEKFIKQ